MPILNVQPAMLKGQGLPANFQQLPGLPVLILILVLVSERMTDLLLAMHVADTGKPES